MTKEHLKQAIISILVGAVAALAVEILEVFIDFLQNWASTAGAGIVATLRHIARNIV